MTTAQLTAMIDEIRQTSRADRDSLLRDLLVLIYPTRENQDN